MEKQPNSRMCFVCGIENPVGLHLSFYTDDEGRCVARFRPRPEHQGYPGHLHGGLISTLLLASLILFLLLSWRTFFVTFHEVLFPAGGWTFDLTSMLIRIFPDRFWFDTFALGVGGALVLSAVVTLIGWLLNRGART